MTNVLPAETGLAVNGVIYRYTVNKETADYMLVHVSNREKDGTGLVFRETDDWSGLPSSTINKMVSVDNIPISRWGEGNIEVEGRGEVTNPTVIYTYRIDKCFDPQSDPSCAGYEPPVPSIVIDEYVALEDEAVKTATKETDKDLYKKKTDEELLVEEKKKDRVNTAVNNALAVAQQTTLYAMTLGVDLTPYYAATINGGVYKDTVVLRDKKLPDGKLGLRNNFAQQIMHNNMVDMQYRRR